MDHLAETAVLLAAGSAAGLVGTAGGITSLISYPALLAVGVPALSANVTNLVALVACWPGSALASRAELSGHRSWLKRWTPAATLGGALGATLLLSTPSGVFSRVVPFLVALGSLALVVQPRLSARREQRGTPSSRTALAVGVVVLSVYNGYFGAGSGVMTLALLMLTNTVDLPTANALKNMLIGAATLAAAVALACFGSVDWSAALPLAAGMFVGATLGPRVARRLSAPVLRWAVATLGLGLSIDLFVRPG